MTFLATGQTLPTPVQADDVQWLSDEDVVAVLNELPRRPMLAGKDGLRLSLLYSDRQSVVAPLYDTLSTAVYPTLTPKMAMKIGSKYKFSEVEARHWEQFAAGAGLARAQARRRILELANSLPRAARALQSDLAHGFAGNGVVERIVALIEQRCALTLRKLSVPASLDGEGSASSR